MTMGPRRWKKVGFFCLALLGLWLGLTPTLRQAGAQDSAAAALPNETTVTIFHTNDFHCTFAQAEAVLRTLRRARAQYPASLLFDAGDMFESKVTAVLQARGKPVVQFMNAAGYDGMTLGDNAFDGFTLDDLRACMDAFRFPVLSANLFTKNDGAPLTLPYWIYHIQGAVIGVVGIYDEESLALAGIQVGDPVYALQHYAKHLRARVDCLAVLSHSGLASDRKLASAVSGLDLIIGGSSQDALQQPVRVGTTSIVQAGAYGYYVGAVQLRIDTRRHRVIECQGWLIPTQGDGE